MMDKKTRNISMAVGTAMAAGAFAYFALPKGKRDEINKWISDKMLHEPMEMIEKRKK